MKYIKYVNKKTKIRLLVATLILFLVFVIFDNWKNKSARDFIEKGDMSLSQSEFNKALRDYYYAVNLTDEKNVLYLAKIKRGEIFLKFNKLEEAERELLYAVAIDKTRYEAYEYLGDVYYKKREFNRSIESYNDALQFAGKEKPSDGLVLKRAKSFIAKGEMELARNVLSDCYSTVPESSSNKEFVYYLGLAEFDLNPSLNQYLSGLQEDENYKQKTEEIKKFLEKYDVKKNENYNSVSVAGLYNFLGEPYFAINKVSKTVAVDSSYRDAWIMLGKSNFIIGNYAAALKNFEKASDLDFHDEEIHFWLGSVFEKMGDMKQANQHFDLYRTFKR